MDFTSLPVIPVIVALIFSIVLHEMMHAYVADRLGDDTAALLGRVTLNPLKHIDPVYTILLPTVLILAHLPPILAAKPVPFNPVKVKWGEYGAALIGIAGPLTNLAIAVVVMLLLPWLPVSASVQSVLSAVVWVNVALFVFNMIPIPPLDGSRALYAIAPEPVQNFMEKIEHSGIMVTMLLFVVLFTVPGFGNTLIAIDSAVYHFLYDVSSSIYLALAG